MVEQLDKIIQQRESWLTNETFVPGAIEDNPSLRHSRIEGVARRVLANIDFLQQRRDDLSLPELARDYQKELLRKRRDLLSIRRAFERGSSQISTEILAKFEDEVEQFAQIPFSDPRLLRGLKLIDVHLEKIEQPKRNIVKVLSIERQEIEINGKLLVFKLMNGDNIMWNFFLALIRQSAKNPAKTWTTPELNNLAFKLESYAAGPTTINNIRSKIYDSRKEIIVTVTRGNKKQGSIYAINADIEFPTR